MNTRIARTRIRSFLFAQVLSKLTIKLHMRYISVQLPFLLRLTSFDIRVSLLDTIETW